MYMSNDDIVKEYKEAKDKQKQITILAQLNACPVQDIRNILADAGCEDIPKRKYNRKTEVTKINGQSQRVIATIPVEPEKEEPKKAKGMPDIIRETIKDKIAELVKLNESAESNIHELQIFIKGNETKIKELSDYIK